MPLHMQHLCYPPACPPYSNTATCTCQTTHPPLNGQSQETQMKLINSVTGLHHKFSPGLYYWQTLSEFTSHLYTKQQALEKYLQDGV